MYKRVSSIESERYQTPGCERFTKLIAVGFLLLILGIIFVQLGLSLDHRRRLLGQKSDLGLGGGASLARIRVNGKWFVRDDDGRVVLFRGINAVRKQPPWVPNDPRNDLTNRTHLLNLKAWGFNTVRLGLMWSGLMPAKGVVNRTYLAEMVGIVDALAELGFYVIVDLHQDMMSSRFASYDGVPPWILDELPESKFEFPWPLKNETLNMSVFAAYITESCGFAFQCLYRNVSGFQTHFLNYWAIVSQTFANRSNILGYELLNEPWAGDVYADPLLLLPSVAGRMNLMPLYDKAYQVIRSHDPTTLIFYEPVTWGVLFDRNYFGTGFNRPPGHDANTTVLSWHYYCWLLQFIDNPLVNNTYPKFDKIVCDSILLTASFEAVRNDLMSLGNSASFLTEFGVCAYKLNETESRRAGSDVLYNVDECKALLEANDHYLQSWAYWDSFFYDHESMTVNTQLVDLFSRVYPTATVGVPKSLHYNSTSKEFHYVFELDMQLPYQANLQTEIFIPPHVYPNGFVVNLSPHLTWFFDRSSNLLILKLRDGNAVKQDGADVRFKRESKISIRAAK